MPIQHPLTDKGAGSGTLLADSAPCIEPPIPPCLRIVDRYRRAARAIVQAELPASGSKGWPVELVKLGIEVHAEGDPERRWAQLAIGEEVSLLFGSDPEAVWPQAPPRACTDPMLRLRQLGHEICPTCATPVPTRHDFARWAGLRLLAAKRRDERRGAIDVLG